MLLKKSQIKQIFKEYRISPKKYLGQNFLIDKFALKKIIKCASLSKEDIVLEIGSGFGVLTEELSKSAKKVIGIEKDKILAQISKDFLKNYKNLQIIEADFKQISLNDLGLKKHKYKVVANLPYSSAVFILRKLLESPICPKEITCLLQKEVAQKICSPKNNLLSLSIKFFGKPKICGFVPKKAFWPKPKVDSAILKIKEIQKNSPPIEPDKFFQIIKFGFSSPRKVLINNLSKKYPKNWLKKTFQELKIPLSARAEELTINDWISLIKKL